MGYKGDSRVTIYPKIDNEHSVLGNKVKKIKCYYAKITHKVEIVKKCHGYNDRIV